MLELSYCFLASFTFFRDIGKFEHALGWGKEENETENGKVEKIYHQIQMSMLSTISSIICPCFYLQSHVILKEITFVII